MPVRKRFDLKTAEGQFNLVKSIFEREKVTPRTTKDASFSNERRKDPMYLGPEKMWMRANVRHDLEQQYRRQIFRGILSPGEAEIFLEKKSVNGRINDAVVAKNAFDLVKLRAQNKFSSIAPEALKKARGQLLTQMGELLKRYDSMVVANRELNRKLQMIEDKTSHEALLFKNAIDSSSHLMSIALNARFLHKIIKKMEF